MLSGRLLGPLLPIGGEMSEPGDCGPVEMTPQEWADWFVNYLAGFLKEPEGELIKIRGDNAALLVVCKELRDAMNRYQMAADEDPPYEHRAIMTRADNAITQAETPRARRAMPHEIGDKYRPSNGSEGECFMAEFCERCSKDSEKRPCGILGRTMAFDVEDPQYPKEWQYQANGPICTAFVLRGSVTRKRIHRRKPGTGQLAMFADDDAEPAKCPDCKTPWPHGERHADDCPRVAGMFRGASGAWWPKTQPERESK
jgi:hypothetical protein